MTKTKKTRIGFIHSKDLVGDFRRLNVPRPLHLVDGDHLCALLSAGWLLKEEGRTVVVGLCRKPTRKPRQQDRDVNEVLEQKADHVEPVYGGTQRRGRRENERETEKEASEEWSEVV